jgi:hypothetical protein
MDRPTALSGTRATGLNGPKPELFTMMDNDQQPVRCTPTCDSSATNTPKQFHLENNQ